MTQDARSAAQGRLIRTGNEDAFDDRRPDDQFLIDVRAVVAYHWSGLPERRPDETVWARLDAVLFDDEGQEREQPDYEARP